MGTSFDSTKYVFPDSFEGIFGTDAEGAVAKLLVGMYQGHQIPLRLEDIATQAKKASQNQAATNLFRSLPDRVVYRGLKGLCASGLLRKVTPTERPHSFFDITYFPTGDFFRIIAPYRT